MSSELAAPCRLLKSAWSRQQGLHTATGSTSQWLALCMSRHLQANRALAGVDAALLALADAADAALQGAASSGMPDGLQSQLRAAAASLREQRLAAVGGLAADAPPTERAAQMQQLLQPAADLAALMQQHYALPAIDKPHQLALAQAAAGRCCAYLRCANVEGEGGPAAGEGVGSKRCRWVAG